MPLTPDEVVELTKKLGASISRTSLVRYEGQNLITHPKRGSYGRGGGRYSDYPYIVVAEAYAAWALMHGQYGFKALNKEILGDKPPRIPPEAVATARFMAGDSIDSADFSKKTAWDVEEGDAPESLKNVAKEFGDDIQRALEDYLIATWRWEYKKALKRLDELLIKEA